MYSCWKLCNLQTRIFIKQYVRNCKKQYQNSTRLRDCLCVYEVKVFLNQSLNIDIKIYHRRVNYLADINSIIIWKYVRLILTRLIMIWKYLRKGLLKIKHSLIKFHRPLPIIKYDIYLCWMKYQFLHKWMKWLNGHRVNAFINGVILLAPRASNLIENCAI